MSVYSTYAMERDLRIDFIEKTHQYKIDGENDPKLVSVTQFIHLFFKKFDADSVIDKMMASERWTESKYFGMTKDEIKHQWDTLSAEASEAGTKLHMAIEHFYTRGEKMGDESTEFGYFLNFHEKFKLECYKTEWRIFDERVKIAGSIDMAFVDPNDRGAILIYDWKRSKEIKFENRYQRGLEPIAHIEDCNFWHYALQLNLYKRIIESNYKLKVNGMAIVVFHPANDDFVLIDIPDLQDEMDALLDYRLKSLTRFKTIHL